MKRKTIIRNLDKKIKEWLKSIKNDDIRILAKKNIIVTGGCITSMLLNEDVNDYDIYFKTAESAFAVAEHYVNKYNENDDKSNFAEIKMDDEKNIKIVFAVRELAKAPFEEDYSPIFLSQNAISLKGGVQLITRFTGSAEEIHKNFDFIHATCSYDYDEGKLELPAKALEAIINRDLYYVGSLYPVCSLFRMRKFLKRGWQISGGQILKMSMQISKLDLMNIDVLRDQLVGVDTLYFLHFIDVVNRKKEENPDFNVDMTYISSVIDKIFGDDEDHD